MSLDLRFGFEPPAGRYIGVMPDGQERECRYEPGVGWFLLLRPGEERPLTASEFPVRTCVILGPTAPL